MNHVRTIAFTAAIASAGVAAMVSAGLAARRVARPTVLPRLTASWNPRAAAAYLDERQGWWESWPRAARDHGTVCVSCHTAVPYALVRPELGATLRETDVPAVQAKLFADVATRVRAWDRVGPFYGDRTPGGTQKAIESRGTEAVLNALILASRDHRTGVVSTEAREAFANMFALQHSTGAEAGAWSWLNFNLRPWESTDAVYYGAALAAIAVGMEPNEFAHDADIQPNVERLRSYLRSHVDQPLWRRILRRDDPGLFNRALLLWASAKLPGLLSSEERHSIMTALWNVQDPDGAWRLTALGRWRQADGVRADSTGDGYATGLVAYALEQADTPSSEPHLSSALAWLAAHQNPVTGAWRAVSLNKNRDPQSNVGKFMSDAATAYAALALSAR